MNLQAYNGDTPTKQQAQFHGLPHRHRLFLGGGGAGKSTALVWECILFSQEHPGSRGFLTRATYPAFEKSTKATFFAQCPPELIAKHVKSEGKEHVVFTNGSTLFFMVLDDPLKLGSIEMDYIAIDEVVEVEERVFRTVLTRLRGKVGPRRLFCATNPPDEDHWLHQFFVKDVLADGKLETERAVVHSGTYDNAENLPQDYIDDLERMPPSYREKYLFGHWGFISDGTPVFQEFKAEQHVSDLFPMRHVKLVRGWDFGFVHPACVWVQRAPTSHVLWLHELQGNNEELRTFAARVVAETERLFPGFEVDDYCDIAGTQKNDRGPTAVQVLRNEFNIFPQCRKIGLHQSLERLRYLLRTPVNGAPLLRINATMRITRKAFAGGYDINPKTQEPNKNTLYDHLIDAGRYATIPITQDVVMPSSVPPPRRRERDWRAAV